MRALVRSEVAVAAPADLVWGYVTDWPRQGEWIPFTRVEVADTGPGRETAEGVGDRIRAWTGIGPVGFWDPMTITAWERRDDGSARCEVLHTGAVVRGEAEFAVHAEGPDACTFVWWERLEVPGGALGALLWRLGGWTMRRGVDAALRRLARRAEGLRRAGHR
jgi:uncharacterized membrane protein